MNQSAAVVAIDKYETLVKLTEGYSCFLYDCDGTLADNMKFHKAAYVKVAATYGLDLDDRIIDEFAGLPTVKVVEQINKRYHTNFDEVGFADAKAKVFHEKFLPQTLPIDFVKEHLLTNAGKAKIGVVSGGRRPTVQRTLEVLGIFDLVDVLVCAGDTEKGKPFPDPFLLAASSLGVSPKACMVFEDGEPGVRAAIAAGMQYIRIDKI